MFLLFEAKNNLLDVVATRPEDSNHTRLENAGSLSETSLSPTGGIAQQTVGKRILRNPLCKTKVQYGAISRVHQYINGISMVFNGPSVSLSGPHRAPVPNQLQPSGDIWCLRPQIWRICSPRTFPRYFQGVPSVLPWPWGWPDGGRWESMGCESYWNGGWRMEKVT